MTLASIFCALAFVLVFAACSHDDEAAEISVTDTMSISAEPSAETIENTDVSSDSVTTSADASTATSSNSQSTAAPASQSSEGNNTKSTSSTQPTAKPQKPSSEKSAENTQKPSQNTNNNGGQTPKPSESAAQPSTTAENLCKKNGHQWGEPEIHDSTYTTHKSSRIVFDDGSSINLASVCAVTFHSHVEWRTCQTCGEEKCDEQLIVTDLWKHDFYPGAEQSVKNWFEQFYIGQDCAKE